MIMVGWNSVQDMLLDFGDSRWNPSEAKIRHANEYAATIDVKLALYTYEDYSGSALVIFEQDGQLFEVNASHCSCFGVEGQWDPEPCNLDVLRKRVTNEGWGIPDVASVQLFLDTYRVTTR